MAARGPSWSRESTTSRTQISDNFKQSLKDIAEGIARHELSEKVLERHVHEAFSLLAISGNRRLPWYQRHEVEVGLGGALVGISASIPTWIEAFFQNDTAWRKAIICAATFVALALGVFLVVNGWLRVRRAIIWTVTWWPKKKPAVSGSGESGNSANSSQSL